MILVIMNREHYSQNVINNSITTLRIKPKEGHWYKLSGLYHDGKIWENEEHRGDYLKPYLLSFFKLPI